MKCCLSRIFWSTLWTRSSVTTDCWSTTSPFIMNIQSPIFDHSTPLSYSFLTHNILATIVHNSQWISPTPVFLPWRKRIMAWIINHKTHCNSLCRDKKKHLVTSYVMVYKATSQVTLPHMQKLSFTLIIGCLK